MAYMETLQNQEGQQQDHYLTQGKQGSAEQSVDLGTSIHSISKGGFFVVRGLQAGSDANTSPFPNEPGSGIAKSSVDEIVNAACDADVILFGECHDDTEAHRIEFDLLKRCYIALGKRRRLILSLEMFERDVQPILDEFMADAISERDLLQDARPWPNYSVDYRPLLLFAKDHGISAVAANAPRRYVSLVGNSGRAALSRVERSATGWLPPLPYAAASAGYAAKFDAQMRALRGDAGGDGGGAQAMP